MADLRAWENVTQLVSIANTYGYEVTPIQIARWHRVGLIPRPQREFLGKGIGSRSLYPPKTHLQVLAICNQLKRSRNFMRVGWHLWRKGYDVEISLIRACLKEIEQRWKSEAALYVDKERGGLSNSAWDYIEASGSKRLRKSFLSKARRRTGKEEFPSTAQVALQIAAGQFDDFDEHPKTKLTVESEESFRRALGFDPEWKMKLDSIAPGLAEISRTNQALTHVRIDDYSDEDLIEARNELSILISALERIIELGRIKILPKDSIAQLTHLHDLFNPEGPSDQALVLWIWLLHRKTDLGKRILTQYNQALTLARAVDVEFLATAQLPKETRIED